MTNKPYWLLALSFLLALANEADAQPPTPKDEFQFVLGSMRQERLKVQSAVCRINGRYVIRPTNAGEKGFDGPLQIFAAFDGQKRRFDSTRPGWEVDAATAQPHPSGAPGQALSKSKRGVESYKYSDNGKKATYWNVRGGANVEIMPSYGDRRLPFDIAYFDLRALGLYHSLALNSQDSFKVLFDAYASMPSKTRIDRTDPAIWAIHWIFDKRPAMVETVLHVNVREGFTPVRLTVRDRAPRNDNEPWTTIQDFRTDWKQLGDVWVPVNHIYSIFKGSSWLEVTMDIAWEKVNEPLDDDLFNWKSFGAPESVGVVDLSLGNPIVIRDIKPMINSNTKWGLVWTIAGCLFVLVAGYAGLIVYRRNRCIATKTAVTVRDVNNLPTCQD
ncbi:MAG: hypothetical protein L0Y72_06955 [Gemmataceae bacterium]|nr:hypothetical protein [Gemmataceae bacterium]